MPAEVMGFFFYAPCLCQPTKDLTCWMLARLCLPLCSLANMFYSLCYKALRSMGWIKSPNHIVLNREEASFKEMAPIKTSFDYCFWEGGAYF